ncbi:MAG TPA: hypothetical protein VH854_00195 [Thermoanaerobaculia bacterium]|nr:hypothetical protein [Thermoanaerobaculia bacterium]
MSRKSVSQKAPPPAVDASKSGRVTLKTVNDALAKRGLGARLMKAGGYFYFDAGEAASWIDKAVYAPTIGSRTVAQWLEEFDRLEKVNRDLLKTTGPRAQKKTTARRP